MTLTDVFIVGLLLGGLFLFFLLKYLNQYNRKKYLKRAKRGETGAVKFLENHGYTIIGIQEKRTIITWINGIPKTNHLTVDIIAKKQGRIYIAEVKTGKKASRPLLAGIRRQLLEYYLAFQPYGILLVDMEKKALHEIAFEIYDKNRKWKWFITPVIIGLIGLICGWFLYKLFNGGF